MEQEINKVLVADEVRKWHSVFKREGELYEIRILGEKKESLSGYFTDIEKAIQCIIPYDNQKKFQIYFTVNEVHPACSSRKQFNQFLFVSGSATSKNDICHRWFLPLDIDVKRPSDVSSTNEEKEYAYKKACDVYRFLQSVGFPLPIVCDSSSGYHLYYPIDLPNDETSEAIVKSIYDILSANFTDERIKIDSVVGDANRIMRLPGSWGRKGRDSDERPHRLARILSVPEISSRANAVFLNEFVSKFKVIEERPAQRRWNGGNIESFDIRSFIRDHDLKVRNETTYANGGTKFVLEECPFDSSHKAPDSAIFVSASGAIGFKCFHDSCSHHDWHELRQMLDPSAYEPKQQQYRPQNNQQYLPVQKYEVKPETPELGKKWFSMSNINKININDIEHFKTGFKELDRLIKGLFFCEVTILSGTNSSGKSSWLNTLIINIIQQSYKVALWSGELRPDVLKTWIQMVAAGKEKLRMTNRGNYWYVPNDVGERIDKWMEGKFFLYNNDYSNKWEQIFSDMKELLSIGVRIFILDNLFSLDIDIFNGDNNKKQKDLIQQICDFAKKEKVHIIIVAHPRKSMTFLRKTDISGTAHITDAADNVFIIHRVNNDFVKTGKEFYGVKINEYVGFGNVIEVSKNRMMGIQDYLCGMYYEVESRRFKNTLEENIRYGWREDGAVQTDMFADEVSTATQSDMPFAATDNNSDLPF